MKKWLCFAALMVLASGCQTNDVPGDQVADIKQEQARYSRGYYPVDPVPIEMSAAPEFAEQTGNALILAALPDETMRLAIGSYSVSGGLSYGPASASYSKGEYVVIMDYTKCTTVPVFALADENGHVTILDEGEEVAGAVVPVYAGVGLRLQAHISVQEGSVNLGSLMALGAAVEAEQASGSLVVQTLGISGESISNLLPMPSEINVSTIQNCLVALGSIKAKMYEDDTQITPRIVGFNTSMGTNEVMTTSFMNQLINHNARLHLGQEIEILDEEEFDDE